MKLLTILLSAATWLKKHPTIVLSMLLLAAISWGRAERHRRLGAERLVAKNVASVDALLDVTRYWSGTYQHKALQTLPPAVASQFGKVTTQSGKKTGAPIAGVIVTRMPDSADVTTPISRQADTVRASLDTLGVDVSVAVFREKADWRVYRRPTTLTVQFVPQGKDVLAIARSSDGAALDIRVPFVGTQDPETGRPLKGLWLVLGATLGIGVGAAIW